MNLYYILFDSDERESTDLHIFAETPERAFELWRQYYDMDYFDEGLSDELIDCKVDNNWDDEDLRIFLIPHAASAERVIDWHSDAKVVAWVKRLEE